MPVKRAAYKALRQTRARRQRNLKTKHQLKKLNVQLRKALTAKDATQAKTIITQYIKALDRASQSGAVHANTAARKKSRISASLKRAA